MSTRKYKIQLPVRTQPLQRKSIAKRSPPIKHRVRSYVKADGTPVDSYVRGTGEATLANPTLKIPTSTQLTDSIVQQLTPTIPSPTETSWYDGPYKINTTGMPDEKYKGTVEYAVGFRSWDKEPSKTVYFIDSNKGYVVGSSVDAAKSIADQIGGDPTVVNSAYRLDIEYVLVPDPVLVGTNAIYANVGFTRVPA